MLSNHHLANIAEDIEINQYISEDWLPAGGLLPSTFPDFNLEPKQGTIYYYEKLLEEIEKQNGSGNGQQTLKNIEEAAQNGQATAQAANGETVQVPNHDWADAPALDEATRKLVEKQVKYQLEQVAETITKSRGTVPGEIADILNKLKDEPAKFDWKGYLRRFVGGSQKVYTHKTRRKYNKRYEDNPGMKIKPKKHILVAVDTSGSVNKNELAEFFHEINFIYKTGAEVTVVHCDTAISHIESYKGGKYDIKIYGRGGTDFQPVIDYYNENMHKFTCLVYFTDGEAPSPDNAKGRILWVMSTQSNMNESLPGTKIKLN
jgi:predicted metal-dependent peptidase